MKHKNYISFLKTFTLRQWIWFYFALALICVSLLSLFYIIERKHMTTIPRSGGTYTEGMLGSVRFINPVLVNNDTERDITSLVFRGLFRKDEAGTLVPVLAKEYSISDDGLTYTVTLKDDVVFQDGTPLTTKDIEYTIKQVQDPIIKSPKMALFVGVSTKIIDDKTIEFKLKQRYTDFLDTLTIGILSKKAWEGVTPEHFTLSEKNLAPMGAGPYKLSSIKSNNKGIPAKITFQRNSRYIEGKPFIRKINLAFFETEKEAIDALDNNEIDTLGGISPDAINDVRGKLIERAPLPRLFGIFFNKNKEKMFQDIRVIQALEYAVNKQDIIDKVFNGYAIQKDSAVPFIESDIHKSFDLDKANTLMQDAGWAKNENGIWQKSDGKKGVMTLHFTIVTTDVAELKMINIMIQEQLNAFGADVSIRTYDMGSFIQDVLNPRDYQALLFGEVLNKPSNLFAFWHSSERNAPGLNVTMYVNQKVDTLLESIKKESDPEKQEDHLALLEKEIEKDKPAIFLFEPMYISASSKEIFNRDYNAKASTSRFYNVHMWSLHTDHVWKLFAKKYIQE